MAAQAKMLPFSTLTAITPLDGRYRKDLESLSSLTSEYALIMTRVYLEIEYLLILAQKKIIRTLTPEEKSQLIAIAESFSLDDAREIKKIEETTKHDVKAAELFLRKKLADSSLADLTEMIHFGITSEDINNLALRHMLRRSIDESLIPALSQFAEKLAETIKSEKHTPMLARTHGQAAVPTTLGKELLVFHERLIQELAQLAAYQLSGKVTGAVGNMNALVFAKPDIHWQKVAADFVSSVGFRTNPVTTQINPYDDVIAYFQILQRLNNILLNFSQDMWRYISDGWFVQVVKKSEVGSSTMPQKVNPIFFENAEGNLGMANTLIDFFTRKLSVTRLQRDLSDSTVTRNFGAALGYSLVAYLNLIRGLSRINPDRERMRQELNSDWSILSEAAQTLLRLEGVKDAYMHVKELARGKNISKTEWVSWVYKLPVSSVAKEKLAALTPETYLGNASQFDTSILKKKIK